MPFGSSRRVGGPSLAEHKPDPDAPSMVEVHIVEDLESRGNLGEELQFRTRHELNAERHASRQEEVFGGVQGDACVATA